MSKKKNNGYNKPVIPSAPAAPKLGAKAPALNASLTTIMRGAAGGSDIAEFKVDATILDEIAKLLPADKGALLSAWLDRFSSICKDFDKRLTAHLENERLLHLEAKNRETSLVEERAALDQQQGALRIEKERLEPRIQELSKREAALAARELELEEREVDARNGFVRLRQEAIAKQKDEIRQMEAVRNQLQTDVERLQETITSAVSRREYELKLREQEVDKKEEQLERIKLRYLRDEAHLEAERQGLQVEIDKAIAQERAHYESELKRQEDLLGRAYERADQYSKQLAGLRELAASLGDRSPDSLLEELEDLRRVNAELRNQQSRVDMEQTQQEAQQLRDTVAMLENKLHEVTPELTQARLELQRRRLAARDLESMAMEKRALEAHQKLLGTQLSDLESRIQKLTDNSKAGSSFPQLSGMDSDDRLQIAPSVIEVPENLKDFAEELQHRIAQAEKDTRLYYPLADIRALLGGLAMSQLHVFQGISGTGKTSLAKAFAKAMGGSCIDIAVQAGWRDRDDLLGHYNAFEKRFYEKDCLQAIYQAQTPAWKDLCNVVLLDEMNLSRPEQYFAEFLSALEKNNPGERLVTLSEAELANAPQLMRERRKVLIPANLWFIGTANHDETTNELADKTYDRAHVMTLPRHEETFSIKDFEPVRYSFSSLQKRFDAAVLRHRGGVEKLIRKLQDSDLTLVLEESFGIGWGNRFERQAYRFIPVMMAAGATSEEALDHLLSTRVMRRGKVTGRYDITVDNLAQVDEALRGLWKTLGDGDPTRSRKLIDEDRRRKEQGA